MIRPTAFSPVFSVITTLSLIFASSGMSQVPCDEEVLLRFKTRAECWQKNNARTCETLPLLEGTAASAALIAKFENHPEYKALKKYLTTVKSVSTRLAKDYKAMLKTYYELKKKSPNPTFEKPLFEFNYAEFEKFKTELKAAHPHNLFLEKFEEYGLGASNDVFQRTMTYARDQMKGEFTMKEIHKVMGSFPNIMKMDLDRMHLIFREVSIENGFPDNGNPKYADPHTRTKLNETIGRRRLSMNADLMKEKTRLGQIGRASIGAMGTAAVGAGVAISALTPIIDLNSKRAALGNCAKSYGINLSERDSIEMARSVELQKGTGALEFNCQNIVFTEEGLSFLFNEGSFSQNQKNLMCHLEAKLGKEQDKMDTAVRWDHENCIKTSQKKGEPYATFKRDVATIYTSDGTQVEVKWNSVGEWQYSSMKSLSDRDFEQYLKDKVKHPLSSRSATSANINPRVLCDGREKGIYPSRMCEISKAMRTLSQNRSYGEEFCGSIKNQGSDSIGGFGTGTGPASRNNR